MKITLQLFLFLIFISSVYGATTNEVKMLGSSTLLSVISPNTRVEIEHSDITITIKADGLTIQSGTLCERSTTRYSANHGILNSCVGYSIGDRDRIADALKAKVAAIQVQGKAVLFNREQWPSYEGVGMAKGMLGPVKNAIAKILKSVQSSSNYSKDQRQQLQTFEKLISDLEASK